jgi:hypothetical protein
MVELYACSPICLHGMVLNEALDVTFTMDLKSVQMLKFLFLWRLFAFTGSSHQLSISHFGKIVLLWVFEDE